MKITKLHTLTWNIEKEVKRIKYKACDLIETMLRRLLFLDPDTSADWIGSDGKVNSEKLHEFIMNDQDRFHRQPRREYYLNQVLRFFFYKWYEPFFTFKRWCRNKLNKFLFFRARKFEYKTHHYISKTKNTHMDGYLSYTVWGIKCSMVLDIISLDGLKSDAYEYDYQNKTEIPHFLDLNKYGKWSYSTLLVPKKTFNEKDIKRVVNLFYKNAVEYKFRHWSYKEGMPTITFDDFHWTEDLCS